MNDRISGALASSSCATPHPRVIRRHLAPLLAGRVATGLYTPALVVLAAILDRQGEDSRIRAADRLNGGRRPPTPLADDYGKRDDEWTAGGTRATTRPACTLSGTQQGSDVALATERIDAWHTKAVRFRRAARTATTILICSSAAVPVVLLAGTKWAPFVLGTLVPAALAALGTCAAAWLHFERPHDTWRLYRCHEHSLHEQLVRYTYALKPYDNANRGNVLVETLLESERRLDMEWAALIPRDTEISVAKSAVAVPERR
jgi:Protein of unknown function (DUF4231)